MEDIWGVTVNCDSSSPDGNACDTIWSLMEYGRLYNGYAVADDRGLCPNGWHVPTDLDWQLLEIELGMSQEEAQSYGYRGSNEGTKLKTTFGWDTAGAETNGTDQTGFSALPGGFVSYSGSHVAGYAGLWWCQTNYEFYAGHRVYRALIGDSEQIFKGSEDEWHGYSVRCIKD